MKCARLLLLLALLGTGCTTSPDPEDRHFYNRGWLNPHKDIDEDPSFDGPVKEPGPTANHQHREYLKDPLVDY